MEWFNRVYEGIKALDVIKEKNSAQAEIIGEDVIVIEKYANERHPKILVYENLGGGVFLDVSYDIYNNEFYFLDEIKVKGDGFYQAKVLVGFEDIARLLETNMSNF